MLSVPGRWTRATGLRKALQWNWALELGVQTEAWSSRSLMAGGRNWRRGTDRELGAFCGVFSHLGLPAIRSDALAWLISWMECSNDPAPHLEERGEGRTSSLMWELTSVSLSAKAVSLLALYGVLWTYQGFPLQAGQWFSIPMWKTMNVRVCWDPRKHGSPHHLTAGYRRSREGRTCSHWPAESEEVRAKAQAYVSQALCVSQPSFWMSFGNIYIWHIGIVGFKSVILLCAPFFFLVGGWLVLVLSAWLCITCFWWYMAN